MKTDVTLHPVDELGAIRAQIANLRQQEKEVEKKVLALIPVDAEKPEVDGQLYHALRVTQIRSTLIADKVREYLNPQQLYHATKVQDVTFLKVSARQTAKVP